MKKLIVLVIILGSFFSGFANHIAGGELFYEYLGAGERTGTAKYRVTMRLFRDCRPEDPLAQKLEDETVVIGIYDNASNGLVRSLNLPRSSIDQIKYHPEAIPCLTNAPDVCFQIGLFVAEVDLPINDNGYTLTWIRCCRAAPLANIGITTSIGATFATRIPGTALVAQRFNSSPQFDIKDTALVCQNKTFVLDFGATDTDGDRLSYSFCQAYAGGSSGRPNPGSSNDIPATLDLSYLPYKSNSPGTKPLGPDVSIDPATGKITGRAPAAGRYVINVCIGEWRDGKLINEHRKDFILQVGRCDFAAADPLPSTGAWCEDFTVKFSNSNPSSTITAYQWDFGVPNRTDDVSTLPNPAFTYPDTGTYNIKLTVKGAAGCEDTKTATVGVYPGFKPDFEVIGSCYQTPFVFNDKSTTRYGLINSWSWDLAEIDGDISEQQNVTHKYNVPDIYNVKLIVKSSKGCVDTITKPVEVRSKPLLTLPFKDTLICSIDTLPLASQGNGTFVWTPAYNIVNPNSATPLVFPKDTTTYVVTLTDPNGCVNSDSIKVNVLDYVNVFAGNDTTICKTDNIVLQPVSHALQWEWIPTSGIISGSNQKNPVVSPAANTTYMVTARLGKCSASDDIEIAVVPYPGVDAGEDVTICSGEQVQLSGAIVASTFTWTPAGTLQNAGSLTPIARPSTTTKYVLTAYDNKGCPKPSRDTVLVNVVPPVKAFAGKDTLIVANQPLQLQASGGTVYAWSPSTGMNNPSVADPIVTLGASYDSVIYKVRVSVPEGCFAEDDIKVTVFKTGPDIFIPSAFTPNADGKNDILKPIPVGIKSFDYFRIYNRWGQLLFNTTSLGKGWDGLANGKEQATGTYIYAARATDYLGKTIMRKGTIVLIR